jgi:acetyltransferase
MSLKHLEQMFKPHSIAVIGASSQPNRPGNAVMRNLLQGGFDGPVMPVTPHYKSVNGVLAYRSIDELPIVPDLAIICTRATRVPAIILQLGRKGVRNAIVIAAGLENLYTAQGTNLQEQMLAIAKQWGLRILGPNSLGLMVPGIGLNASYANTQVKEGKIAFVSQSSAVCMTLLDWAKRRRIGFSYVIDLGESTDIDFDEMIDYLGRDAKTSAILLYIDGITDGRAFMSAARAASSNKPILVIKTGINTEHKVLMSSLPADRIGHDAVYDAAFKRAGMLRVGDLRELLAAVETLANGKPINGEQLVILANGNAPGAMALDMLAQDGGRLAALEPAIIAQLQAVIHSGGRATNPINVLGDAGPEHYREVLEILLQSSSIENLLIMHAPSFMPGEMYAQVVIDVFKNHRGHKPNILVNWMGEDAAVEARQRFAEAGIASFRTPEGVVGAFMHMVQYRRNQKLLSETPDSISNTIPHHPEIAQTLIAQARAEGRTELNREEAVQLLNAYSINTVPTKTAINPEDAAFQAMQLGFPVALKIELPNHLPVKSDVGGVVLNLGSATEVAEAARNSLQQIANVYPDIVPAGFTLQAMARRTGAYQLRIQVQTDPVFGPVILLGDATSNWIIRQNAVVALPPLNMALARYLVIQGLAEGKIRERELYSPLNIPALCVLLTKISQIIIDNPHLRGLTINPALATGDDIRVLDVSVDLVVGDVARCLAIRPYPNELEETTLLRDGRVVVLRPIRPEDEAHLQIFDNSQSKEDRYKRYFAEMPQFSHEQMVRFTQIDYEREMAFIAVAIQNDETEILGVVRAQRDPDNTEAEFAIAIRSDLKGIGLGSCLLKKMIDYCRAQGTRKLVGATMLENNGMANLARKLGFNVRFNRDDELIGMQLDLQVAETNG